MSNWFIPNDFSVESDSGKPDEKPNRKPNNTRPGASSHATANHPNGNQTNPNPPSGDPVADVVYRDSGNWTRDYFPQVYTALTRALEPHPEAHAAVRNALNQLHSELFPR